MTIYIPIILLYVVVAVVCLTAAWATAFGRRLDGSNCYERRVTSLLKAVGWPEPSR